MLKFAKPSKPAWLSVASILRLSIQINITYHIRFVQLLRFVLNALISAYTTPILCVRTTEFNVLHLCIHHCLIKTFSCCRASHFHSGYFISQKDTLYLRQFFSSVWWSTSFLFINLILVDIQVIHDSTEPHILPKGSVRSAHTICPVFIPTEGKTYRISWIYLAPHFFAFVLCPILLCQGSFVVVVSGIVACVHWQSEDQRYV